MTLPDIHGLCPPRFAAVKDAFAANFTDAPEGLNEDHLTQIYGGKAWLE